MTQTTEFLFSAFEKYKISGIAQKNIKHAELKNIITSLNSTGNLKVRTAGHSFEGREIYHIVAGTGHLKVFLWSQMHGDEPTATMALLDILNFLSATNGHNEIRQRLFNNLEMHFVPMLNPDGAERFMRRNSQGLDLNRDALELIAPESQILKSLFDMISPSFAFNLHDQSGLNSVGRTGQPAALAFLAPPTGFNNPFSTSRQKAAELISWLSNELSALVSGLVTKYSDEYEPRAFGDYFQQRGASVVLIESGVWRGDPEKQYLRKINFTGILTALDALADGNTVPPKTTNYDALMQNEKIIYDFLFRNVTIKINDSKLICDIAINLKEYSDSEYIVEDIGDLSMFFGNSDMDCSHRAFLSFEGPILPGENADRILKELVN